MSVVEHSESNYTLFGCDCLQHMIAMWLEKFLLPIRFFPALCVSCDVAFLYCDVVLYMWLVCVVSRCVQ